MSDITVIEAMRGLADSAQRLAELLAAGAGEQETVGPPSAAHELDEADGVAKRTPVVEDAPTPADGGNAVSELDAAPELPDALEVAAPPPTPTTTDALADTLAPLFGNERVSTLSVAAQQDLLEVAIRHGLLVVDDK